MTVEIKFRSIQRNFCSIVWAIKLHPEGRNRNLALRTPKRDLHREKLKPRFHTRCDPHGTSEQSLVTSPLQAQPQINVQWFIHFPR